MEAENEVTQPSQHADKCGVELDTTVSLPSRDHGIVVVSEM